MNDETSREEMAFKRSLGLRGALSLKGRAASYILRKVEIC